ncbi:jumonji domain-containing protein 1 [Fonsecaea monophora]|uniref:Jumonji domain-containing protein 1 n=1 Tax=Fonsecaea monophora TaxID=254056 RepID=A0A177FIZ2_9EURO|nr:jumonji domain-containing protein 1 [Fonsecaea monophora]OAG43686.1 jumonji domain-containing protein 1 [Fonsecaea monophora]
MAFGIGAGTLWYGYMGYNIIYGGFADDELQQETSFTAERIWNASLPLYDETQNLSQDDVLLPKMVDRSPGHQECISKAYVQKRRLGFAGARLESPSFGACIIVHFVSFETWERLAEY